MSYILRLAMVLALITAIAAGALTLTNQFTADRIAEQQVRAKLDALEAVLPAARNFTAQPELLAEAQAQDTRLRDVTELYLAEDATGPVGVACGVSVPGYGGPINMMVGVDQAGQITGVRIVSAAGETPGLGAKITEASWLRQFVGQDTSDPLVLVKGPASDGEIQSIAAATLSAAAVLRGVNAAAATFQQLAGEGEDRLVILKEQAVLEMFPAADLIESDPELLESLVAGRPELAEATDIYWVRTAGEVVGTAIAASGDGYGGPILAVVGFDQQGRIAGVAFVDMPGETVGLGTKIAGEAFTGQFTGKPASPLTLTRAAPGAGEIQALASATISCQGAVDAVNNAIRLHRELGR